jgi:type I restriction enzyme S subunit
MGLEHVESWTGRRIPDADAASDGVATHFMSGDVLFGKLRPYLAKVYLADCEGVASTELLVLRSEEDVCPEFLRYYAVSKDFINAVDSSTYGAKMPRANWELIGNLPFLIPSPDEQRSIAKFLDQKELIKKLTEQRSALITAAVTGKVPEIGGRKSAVRMKDSGISWIGTVPEHWEVAALRWFIRAGSGDYIASSDVENNPANEYVYPVIGGNGIMAYAMDFNTQSNALILGRVGAHCGNVHLIREACWVTDNALRITLVEDELSQDFLFWLFKALRLNDSANKNAQPLITGEIVKAKYIGIPPKNEQQAIAAYLDEKTGKIDGLIQKTETAIQTLEEYRTALITAAVTGKIDVSCKINLSEK